MLDTSSTSLINFIHGLTQPLEAWSIAHRLSVAAGLALLTFGVSLYLWATAQTINVTARHNVVSQLTERVQAAATVVANLPVLRKRIKNLAVEPNTENAANTDTALLGDVSLWQTFSTAITGSGLSFKKFEPDKITRQADWRERSLKLQVSGSLANLASFTTYIAHLPLPIVPMSAQLNADKNGQLSFTTILRVIGINDPNNDAATDALKESPNAIVMQPAQFPPLTNSLALTPWQLVGVLQQASMQAALVRSSNDFKLLYIGSKLDDEEVTHIDQTSLSLSGKQGTRTLSLRDAK